MSDGGLVHGGGRLAICGGGVSIGGCGGWWKRRRDDDGSVVGLPLWAESIERRPSACALFVPDLGSYPCWPACLRNGSLRKVTTTIPYTDSLHGEKRPRAGAIRRGTWGNLRVTQPHSRRTVGGCGWEAVARCASMGLATPHLVEDRIADGPRSPEPRGWIMIGSGRQLAQHPCQDGCGGGW